MILKNYTNKVILLLILSAAIVVGSNNEVFADNHNNFISDKDAQKFVGIWKVKRTSRPFFTRVIPRSIWSISVKNKKLTIDIPEADIVFDNVKIDGNKLYQIIEKTDEDGVRKSEWSIDIEVVDGLFDGTFIENDARIGGTGRFEKLYDK